MDRPRVFVSYSWNASEGPGHEEWVLNLASDLVKRGVDVRLDKWHLQPGESVSAFMEQEAIKADFVLAVCTPEFARKSNNRVGGVGYEQQIISGRLLEGVSRSRFIPLLRKGSSSSGDDCAIPTHFLGTLFIDFRQPDQRPKKLQSLLRAIFGLPGHARPKLGQKPFGIGNAAAHGTSEQQDRIVISVSSKFEPVDASLAEAIDDMEIRVSTGRSFTCALTVEGISTDRAEYYRLRDIASPSAEERRHRRKLREQLIATGLIESVNKRDVDIIDEASMGVDLICRDLRFDRQLIRNDLELDRSIKSYLRLVKGSALIERNGDTVSFDFMSPGGEIVVIDLTEAEMNRLEKKFGYFENKIGLERVMMWAVAGMDFTDVENLGRDIVVDRVVPTIVHGYLEFVRYGQPIDPKTYFNLAGWKIGLH